jgi:hypothetical protein
MEIPDYLHGRLNEIISAEANRAFFMERPSVMLGAKIFKDGNAWCCLLGENIQEGVCGFGESPNKASAAFDVAWDKEA